MERAEAPTFEVGDPVNWTSAGKVVYGFVEEACPRGTARLKKIRVADLQKRVWHVPLENLRPTE